MLLEHEARMGQMQTPSWVSQPQRISDTNSVSGQAASGAGKEVGILAATLGTSGAMDLAATANQLKHATVDPSDRSGKNWLSQPSRVPVPGEGASPINFHTEKWDDFAEIPGTTDFWAKKLGIPFENTTPEIVGRLVGGLLGMAAPLIPGTKAFVRALREIALTPSPVGPSTMRGSVGFGDNKNALADDALAPTKTRKAYKLFRQNKKGELFPLFVGKSKATPVGEWIPAEHIPTEGFSERPGWHVGESPNAPHLMKKDGTMADNRVWAEVEIGDDVDWQTTANASKTKDIRNEVPRGGNYTFKRPTNQGGAWNIAGEMKVNRVLSPDEVEAVNAWQGGGGSIPNEMVNFLRDEPISAVRMQQERPMTKAQAKAAGYPRDQRWHPLSKNQLRRPLDQVERVVEDDGLGLMSPAVTISPEELQGGTLIPALGDRSDIGKNLSSVGGNALASPVRLEGGHGYMRQGDESVWASAEGKVSALNKKANKALEAGSDPYLVYVPMGHDPMDFNTMMTDATYELMKGGELSKTARNKFDRLMRQKRNLWPGIDSDEARTMLDGNGEARKAFMSIVGREEFRNLPGMPDVAELRYALTDPDLLDVPLGQGGQSIARASGKVVQDPMLPHSTYDQQMSGEYVGGFGKEGVPREIMFPDFIKARRAARDDTGVGYDARSMEFRLPTQEANQEWVDGMMKYLTSKGMTAAAAAAVLGAGTQRMQEEPTNALAGS